MNNLYNVSKTASGGDLISYHPNREKKVEKIKLSLSKRYNNMTPEERKKIYGSPGHLNGMYGKTHTDEVKKKMLLRMIGNQYAKRSIRNDQTRKKFSLIAKKNRR